MPTQSQRVFGNPPQRRKYPVPDRIRRAASFVYQPEEIDGGRPKGTGEYKTSYKPVLRPEVLNGPMELIKGKPFAVEWSY